MSIKRMTYPRRRSNPPPVLPKGGLRRSGEAREPELFTGEVKGFKASQGEERAATALTKNEKVREFYFRMTIGAERNMPGFKELDLLVEKIDGSYVAIEVDSAFTHRDKGTSDVLHDAIVLNALKSLNIHPQVIHLDIDRDLPDQKTADKTMKNLFG